MRLIEEKISIKLQIISLITLVFMTIMIQVADYNISKYDSTTLKMILTLIENHQVRNDYKFNANIYTILRGMGVENIDIDPQALQADFFDPVFSKKAQDYKDGKISKIDFITHLITHNKAKSKELFEYNNKSLGLIQKRVGSRWVFWRNFFVVFQFIGLSVLILGYYQLVGMISKRLNKNT